MRMFTDILNSQLSHCRPPDGPTGIDLFSGAGGLTLGLKAAGVRTIAAVEVEPNRIATYLKHTSAETMLVSDIRQVDFTPFRRRIDLLYGGPPCQPFSSGGLRRAMADERNMIPHFLRAVEIIDPASVLLENVPGLASGDRVHYLQSIVEQLEQLGYSTASKVLNAADFGVPQKRRRLFVVGMKNGVFQFPKATHGPGCEFPHVSVRAALPESVLGELNPSKVFYAKSPDLRPSPFDGHLFNGGGRPINLDVPCHTILASAGGNKTHFFDTRRLVPAYHRHLMQGGTPRLGTLVGGRRLTVEESALI